MKSFALGQKELQAVGALITNNLDGTDIKSFYIGPMFRYERPQKGRKRQFCQAGIELIGDSSINADIEVIQIATLILKELDIQAELQINFIGDSLKAWMALEVPKRLS